MERLLDVTSETIGRGAILRVRGQYPYEAIVDFMVVESSVPDRPIAIMVATGHSAGHTFVVLPSDATVASTRMLSAAWLKANWSEWVYPHCPVEEVGFLVRYPAPTDDFE